MHEKILVVDDNKNNVMLLVQILEEQNYEVMTLDRGENIVEEVLNGKPDCILLDIMMYEVDGIQACKNLKMQEETKEIPVIMVTAKAASLDLEEAFEAGAFDYIKKPIDEIEVLARLKVALNFYNKQKNLENIAMMDGLTGLYNHRLVLELLEKELYRSTRKETSLVFAMIDIDYFKSVNDEYGHQVGDKVLKNVGNKILENVRTGDIVGRYGGEEFSIVLPGCSEDEAKIISERIRNLIEENIIVIDQQEIKVTVSIGTFYKGKRCELKGEEIVRRADELLYQAKRNGRNRVEYGSLN